MNRSEMLQRVGEKWDILIIGGGATGLGTAVDASSRGFKTILLEQSDFAKGTSITINGKTTAPFTFQISELKDDLGNSIEQAHAGEIVSFLVPEKVRKNDLILNSF